MLQIIGLSVHILASGAFTVWITELVAVHSPVHPCPCIDLLFYLSTVCFHCPLFDTMLQIIIIVVIYQTFVRTSFSLFTAS